MPNKKILTAAIFTALFFPQINLQAATTEVWDGIFTVNSPEMCSDYSSPARTDLAISDSGKITGSFSDTAGTTGSVTGTLISEKFNYEVSSGGTVIIKASGVRSEPTLTVSGNFTSYIECFTGSGPLTGVFTGNIRNLKKVQPVAPTAPAKPAAPAPVIPAPAADIPVQEPAAVTPVSFEERMTGFIRDLQKNPQAIKLARQIAVPVSVTMSVASAGALTVTATQGSATVAFNLSQFFRMLDVARFYLIALLRFEKKKPWGRVIDRFSGTPIPGATVEIYNADYNKMRDKQLTDSAGRFSGLVEAGTYYAKVAQKGYEIAKSAEMTISSPDKLLNLEIAMSPVGEFLSEYINKINLWNSVKKILNRLNPIFLLLGTLSALGVAIIIPSMINYGLFGIYLVLGGLKLYLSRHIGQSFGSITDASTGQPLPLAVLRIFDAKKNWLLATKVSDSRGRFDFLLSLGNYYITSAKTGYAPLRSEPFVIKGADTPLPDLAMKKSRE